MTDWERVFRDACDEAGCAYDNEALLQAISDLKRTGGIAQNENVALRAELNKALREIVDLRMPIGGVAQDAPRRGDLTKLAAECHRAKWEFDLSEDYTPSRAVARALVLKAFAELHRIGDMALKLCDGSAVSSTQCAVTDCTCRPGPCAFPSPSRDSASTYCALCDHEHQLHEDAQGFHHVVKGARVVCPCPFPTEGK